MPVFILSIIKLGLRESYAYVKIMKNARRHKNCSKSRYTWSYLCKNHKHEEEG